MLALPDFLVEKVVLNNYDVSCIFSFISKTKKKNLPWIFDKKFVKNLRVKAVLTYGDKQVNKYVQKLSDLTELENLDHLFFTQNGGGLYNPGLPVHEHTLTNPTSDGYVGFMEGSEHHGVNQKRLTRVPSSQHMMVCDHSLEELFFINKKDYIKYEISNPVDKRRMFKVPAQVNFELPFLPDRAESMSLRVFLYNIESIKRFNNVSYEVIENRNVSSKVIDNNLLSGLLSITGTPFKNLPLGATPNKSDTEVLAEDTYNNIQVLSPLKISKSNGNSVGGIFSINVKNLLNKHTNHDLLINSPSILSQYLSRPGNLEMRIVVERVFEIGTTKEVCDVIFKGSEKGVAVLEGQGSNISLVDLTANPFYTKSFYFVDTLPEGYVGNGPEEKWRYKIKAEINNNFDDFLKTKIQKANEYILSLEEIIDSVEGSSGYKDKLQIIGDKIIEETEVNLSLNEMLDFIKDATTGFFVVNSISISHINSMNSYNVLGVNDLRKMRVILLNMSDTLDRFIVQRESTIVTIKNEKKNSLAVEDVKTITAEHFYKDFFLGKDFDCGFNFVPGRSEPLVYASTLSSRLSTEAQQVPAGDSKGYLSVFSTVLKGRVIQNKGDNKETEQLALSKILNYKLYNDDNDFDLIQEQIQSSLMKHGCLLVDRANQHLIEGGAGDVSKQDGSAITSKDIYGNMDPSKFFEDFTLENQKRKKTERDEDYESFYDLNLSLIFSKDMFSKVDFEEVTGGLEQVPPHFESITSFINFQNLASIVFNHRNLARVEYVSGVQDSGIENWTTLTQSVLRSLVVKKALLCRLVALKPIKNTDLPIYNEYFFVYKNTEEVTVSQTQTSMADTQPQAASPGTAVPPPVATDAVTGGGGMTGGGGGGGMTGGGGGGGY